MPGQHIEAQTGLTPSQGGAREDFDPHEFLVGLGIESLANRPVKDHEGNVMPLSQALVRCTPIQVSLASTAKLINKHGGKDVDVVKAMAEHVDDLGEEAQRTKIPNQGSRPQDSKKK